MCYTRLYVLHGCVDLYGPSLSQLHIQRIDAVVRMRLGFGQAMVIEPAAIHCIDAELRI